MSDPTIDLSAHGMVALSRTSLRILRAALMREGGGGSEAATALREAGYLGADRIWGGFQTWLAEQRAPEPGSMSLEDFESYASAYFQTVGWGVISVGSLHDAVAVVDADDWSEADPDSALAAPGCHFTTGMLADFFGRVSDTPLAVLEVECRSTGSARCRFLLGAEDVMTYVYEEMDRGESYDAAVARIE